MEHIRSVRNIGISAHIDSGKTTLSERILYYTGRIHAMHEVHGKDGVGATLDWMDLEKERGISIQSAATYCEWKDHQINLIDTPGHVDFTIEVERALRVLDGAILVLDSVAGVQSQTITVDRQMRRYGVPRLAFVNKMDRTGADLFRVSRMLRERLGHTPLNLQMPIGSEEDFRGVIDLLTLKAFYFDGPQGEEAREEVVPAELLDEAKLHRHELIETLADLDDDVALAFLDEEHLSIDLLRQAIRRATISLRATPVFLGSALRNKGVQLLLDGVLHYLPSPVEVINKAFDAENREVVLESNPDRPFVGFAFKLEDGRFGQLTYVRLYQGRLCRGDVIVNRSQNGRRLKVNRIVRMHANEMDDVTSAEAGDIVALFGAECNSGDTLTADDICVTMTSMHIPEPVISIAVAPKSRNGSESFSRALQRFTREDPTLRVRYDESSGQTILSGMGELHLEVYLERIRREYNCEVVTGRPQVAYREAISRRAVFSYTHKKQTGGRGQYAKIEGYIEPLPPDAVLPYEFVDNLRGDAIPSEYMPAIDKGFREAARRGSLIGFPVVGLRVVIDNGQSHPVDSSEQAFRTAGILAFRQAYPHAGPMILEPIMKIEITVPNEFQGSVLGMISQRRGYVSATFPLDGSAVITAEVPLAEMFGFATDLRSATQGKGEFTMEPLRYAPAPRAVADELIAEYQRQRRQD